MCQKIQFATRGEAKKYARREKSHGSGRMRDVTPYECPRCDQWHLSSMSRQEARRKGLI
jgi:ssDNA-binding Zn-finger/Zn-ribbon topoisomerase 1